MRRWAGTEGQGEWPMVVPGTTASASLGRHQRCALPARRAGRRVRWWPRRATSPLPAVAREGYAFTLLMCDRFEHVRAPRRLVCYRPGRAPRKASAPRRGAAASGARWCGKKATPSRRSSRTRRWSRQMLHRRVTWAAPCCGSAEGDARSGQGAQETALASAAKAADSSSRRRLVATEASRHVSLDRGPSPRWRSRSTRRRSRQRNVRRQARHSLVPSG